MAAITTNRIKKGLRLFLIITILTLLIILVFTVRAETWQALNRVSVLFLLLSIVITLARLYMESLRVQVLSWAGGKWISLKDSLDFTLGSLFMGAVTPFQSGGIPLQLYILNRSGISLGRGTNIILLKGLLPTFIFFLTLPFILIYYKDLFESPFIRGLAQYLFMLYFTLLILLFYVFLNPPWVRRGLIRLEGFLKRKGIVKGDWGTKLLEKGFHQMEEFKKGLKESLSMGRMKLLLAFFLSIVGMALHAITAPILLLGLGVDPHFLTSMILQVLLYFLLLFAPTPGAGGIAEGAAFILFSQVCPKPLLGIFILLLRFFYLYLAAAIGGVLLLQRIKSREIQLNSVTEKKDPTFSTSNHSKNSEGQ
jgi:uncharacterized protein (TIRG00374 family)